MILEKKIILPLLRTKKVWISTPTLSGTFNGSVKARVIKESLWSAFLQMEG
jgi:hypothetical protein